MSNIQKIIDFYVSRNKETKIELIYVLGEGSNLKGFRELCANQLRISMSNIRRIREFKGVEIKKGLEMEEIMLHRYMNNIGAIIDPVGFLPEQIVLRQKKAGQAHSAGIVFGLTVLASLMIVLIPYANYQMLQTELEEINFEIERIQDVQQIEKNYTASLKKYQDLQNYLAMQESGNNRLSELMKLLEGDVPTQIVFSSFHSTEGAVSIGGTSASKEAVAELIMRLKEIEGIDDVYVGSLSKIGTSDDTSSVAFAVSFTMEVTDDEQEETSDETQS